MVNSQYHEDVRIISEYFYNVTGGTFVELGAFDGISMSNTRTLAEYFGWSGVLIEPQADIFRQLKQNRNESYIFNLAVCKNARDVNVGTLVGPWMRSSGQILPDNFTENPYISHVPCRPLHKILGKTNMKVN